ncbi:hypothetical protein [Paraburkholderia youngii]|uniref:hypothetical protein n=1 Tax=Paraburkholderia youngii TaxID=2782701 RepID=UPI003D21D9DC
MIEAAKMVHVSMGNKYVRQTHQLAGQQPGDIAKIKEQGAAFVAKVYIQTWVGKRVIDKPGANRACVDLFARRTSSRW